MGLGVNVYTGKLGSSDWEILAYEVGDNLVGSEDSRSEVWGSGVVNSLGLKILPTLTQNDIYAEGEALLALETEVKVVQQNATLIASHVPMDEYSINVIANNIMKAINRAKEIKGGVVIW